MAVKKFIDITGAQYIASQVNLKAPIASPTFTGTPQAPTAVSGDKSKQIATTEFVTAAIEAEVGSVYSLKGEVENFADLPTTATAGDTYIVKNEYVENPGAANEVTHPAGTWWVKTDEGWKPMNTNPDLSEYATKVDLQNAIDGIDLGGEVEAIAVADLQALFEPAAP